MNEISTVSNVEPEITLYRSDDYERMKSELTVTFTFKMSATCDMRLLENWEGHVASRLKRELRYAIERWARDVR